MFSAAPVGRHPVSWPSLGQAPRRRVRDEFRPLDDRRLIGLTFAGGPWSRVAAAPLLLSRV